MKLKFESIDLPESVWKEFALAQGYPQNVEGIGQSPIDFIIQKYGTPVWEGVADFNTLEAKKISDQAKVNAETDLAFATAEAQKIADQKKIDAENDFAQVRSEALNQAKQIINVTLE